MQKALDEAKLKIARILAKSTTKGVRNPQAARFPYKACRIMRAGGNQRTKAPNNLRSKANALAQIG